MKLAGRAVIFELRDMIGTPDVQAGIWIGDTHETRRQVWVRSVPEPFHDGLLARFRSAWEVLCGRAYPAIWPEPGDLERALQPPRKEVTSPL